MADDVAFPTLDAAALETVAAFGTRRPMAAGDELFTEGDEHYDFFVILSGQVDILGHFADGEEHHIARHGAGRFLGELSLLTGQRVYLTGRVHEAGEVIAIPIDGFRRLIATQPELSDLILDAFMARRTILLTGAAGAVRVVGSRFSAESLALREFLARNRLPHQWSDADGDPEVDQLLRQFGVGPDELPVVMTGGGVLRRATPGSVASCLGLTIESVPERCFDLIVVGAGPAGLAASVYGASEGLHTLTVEALVPGGQAGTSSRIENYFGFPAGISGLDLTSRALIQAQKFGAQLTSPCDVVELGEKAGHHLLRLSDGTELAARAVVVATGARYRRLDVPQLETFEQAGVYYAATDTEARLCAGSPVVVVGGGNSAGQAAMFLAGRGSPVTLAVRGKALAASMSRYLSDRIEAHPNITLRTGARVTALHGAATLSSVTLSGDDGDGEVPASALFSFIGADPTTAWLGGGVVLDHAGFVLTDRALRSEDLDDRWEVLGRAPLSFETSLPGLFAVGDVRSGSTKRVAAAVGEGSAAVRSVHEHLAFTG